MCDNILLNLEKTLTRYLVICYDFFLKGSQETGKSTIYATKSLFLTGTSDEK